jgi:dihydroorotase
MLSLGFGCKQPMNKTTDIPSNSSAPLYDLLIKGGRIIDARNKIQDLMDLAVNGGRIAKVAADIPRARASRVIDAGGLLVCPGFIDMHSHHFIGTEANAYLSNGPCALPPDGFTFRSGVTTVVDTGGAGWKNFEQFKQQTIDTAVTRILALLNIVGSGMKGGEMEQNKADMDPEKTAGAAQKYSQQVVGIKLAHFMGPDWEPTERTVTAGVLAGLPVMIDFGRSEPKLPLETLFMEKLRPGDIFTHCYARVSGREALVDSSGRLRPLATQARVKGIWFDVGHGEASFDFNQAIPALEQGFFPDSISSDLHTGSMNGGMKDLCNVLSKFINLNMPLVEVIRAASWNPARCIGRTDLGHLSEGAVADITLLNLCEGSYGFIDAKGNRMAGNRKLECELTLREGKVVYDLNGLSAPHWEAGVAAASIRTESTNTNTL